MGSGLATTTNLAGLLLEHKQFLDRRLGIALNIAVSSGIGSIIFYTYGSKLLRLRKNLIDLFREVLVGLQHMRARHCGAGLLSWRRLRG